MTVILPFAKNYVFCVYIKLQRLNDPLLALCMLVLIYLFV